MTMARDLLVWLGSNGSVLESAAGASATDLDRRRLDEVHLCLGCGARAGTAFIANTGDGPRWLDLCMPCAHEALRIAIAEHPWWPAGGSA